MRNLIVFSDTHFGDRVGLCTPKPFRLDGGGWYEPSEFQTKMYGMFEEFFEDWVPQVTRRQPFDLVHNGDVIEGVHHGATHQISHNIGDQMKLAQAIMGPIIKRVHKP